MRRWPFSGLSIGCSQCMWRDLAATALISKNLCAPVVSAQKLANTLMSWSKHRTAKCLCVSSDIPATRCSSNAGNYLTLRMFVCVSAHVNTLRACPRNLANLFMHSSEMSLRPADHSWRVLKPFQSHSVHFVFWALLMCPTCRNKCFLTAWNVGKKHSNNHPQCLAVAVKWWYHKQLIHAVCMHMIAFAKFQRGTNTWTVWQVHTLWHSLVVIRHEWCENYLAVNTWMMLRLQPDSVSQINTANYYPCNMSKAGGSCQGNRVFYLFSYLICHLSTPMTDKIHIHKLQRENLNPCN